MGRTHNLTISESDLNKLERDLNEMTLRWERANDALFAERALADRLAEAANAVIDQWETPNWRLRESTAKYMNTLRNTLAAWKEARSE